jgi:hypothetical protein
VPCRSVIRRTSQRSEQRFESPRPGTYKHPRHVRPVQSVIRLVGVSIRIPRLDRARPIDVIRVVPGVRPVHLIKVTLLESAGRDAGVDDGLIDASELGVRGDPLSDVEGVRGDVAGIIQGEETRIDNALGVRGVDPQADLETGREVGDRGLGVGGEGGTVIGGDAPDGMHVRRRPVVVVDVQSRGEDVRAVLDDVSSRGSQVGDRASVGGLEAVDLGVQVGRVASYAGKDLLSSEGVRSVDGKVQAVLGSVIALQSERLTAPEVRHGNRSSEQPIRTRHAQESFDRPGPGRLADDRHLVRISTECGDVGLDPFESDDLVRDPVVAGNVRTGDGEEPERTQTVVDADDDDVFTRCELTAVACWVSACSSGISTPVDPEVNGAERVVGTLSREVRRLDVQEETVLGAGVRARL